MYSMAVAISKGEIFLGHLETVQNKVLFIQADESRNNAVDKLFTMGIEDGIDFHFVEDGWSDLDVEALTNEIKKENYGVSPSTVRRWLWHKK